MPMYEYKCNDCDNRYEELVMKSGQKVPCPQCGSENTCKLVSTFSSSSLASDKSCSSCSTPKSGFS